MVVREAALKIRLNLHSPAFHIPGPVRHLGTGEEVRAAAERRIAGRYSHLVQGIEGLPGGICVAGKVWSLRPAPILPLSCYQFANAFFLNGRLDACPFESEKLHDAVFRTLWRLLREPIGGTPDAFGPFLLAAGHTVRCHSSDSHRRARKIAILDRGA